jgi:hypothetical protein
VLLTPLTVSPPPLSPGPPKVTKVLYTGFALAATAKRYSAHNSLIKMFVAYGEEKSP